MTGPGTGTAGDDAARAALGGVVLEATQVTSPAELAPAFDRLAERALGGPGPCHLEIAADAVSDAATVDAPRKQAAGVQAGTRSNIAASVGRIGGAKFPVIVAGRGALGDRPCKALRHLAETSGIAVVATPGAKGVMDDDADESLLTLVPAVKGAVGRAVAEADLWIGCGVYPGELPSSLWPEDKTMHLEGDLEASLVALAEQLGERDLAGAELVQAARADVLGELAAHREDDTVGRLDPRKVVSDVRDILGPHDVLITDTGAHGLWVQHYYPCHEPRTCLSPSPFRPMGTALPGAVAARLALPDRRVVAICGDGTLLVNLQEMETARRLASSVVVVVWVDDAFGLVSLRGAGAAPLDTSFGNPDFVALAESFGWRGVLCDRSGDFRDILRKEVDIDEPSLIAVPVDYGDTAELLGRQS